MCLGFSMTKDVSGADAFPNPTTPFTEPTVHTGTAGGEAGEPAARGERQEQVGVTWPGWEITELCLE